MKTPIAGRAASAFLSSIVVASHAGAAEHTYQYYRFEPLVQRVYPTQIQLSEFQFKRAGTVLNLTGVVVTNPDGSNAADAAQGAQKVIDLDTATKWFDNKAKPLVFDFGSPTTIDEYNFATANDFNQRDPVSWIFSGSTDGVTWVDLDHRKFYPTVAARLAYDFGFLLPATPVIRNFSTNKTIVTNGTSDVVLSWNVSGATSVSIDQGFGEVAATGSETLSLPNSADRTYTLTATNDAGTTVERVTVRSVPGTSLNYRYYRFLPTKLRATSLANSIQLSEFQFYHSDASVFPVAAENTPGGNSPEAEPPAKLYDNDLATKWLDFNKGGVIFDMGEISPMVDGYSIGTADDALPRDPVRWYVEGSYDKTNWTLVDNITTFDYNLPGERRKYSQDIPFPGASLTPLGPFVTFTGDRRVVAGSGVALAWDVTEAATVSIQGIGTVPASGSTIVHPTATTTYILTATGASGTTATAEHRVEVVHPAVTTINYPNFDAAGQELSLIGSATVVNAFATIPQPANAKRLRITPNTGSVNGTAWFRKRVAVGAGFETNFGLHFISEGTGADGMSFMIQSGRLGSISAPSSTHENGLPANSLNVSFDSYLNAGDPSAAVVRVLNGTTVLTTVNLGNFPAIGLGGTASAPDLTKSDVNAAPYAVRITYVPGDLDIYMNGVLIVENLNVTLEQCNAVEDGLAWVGFSARTGGLAETHDVTSWTLVEGPPSTGGPAPLELVSHSINRQTNQVTLVWTSAVGNSYRITTSTDLSDWTSILQDNIAGAAGQTSATVTFTAGTRRFFRVERK